MTYTAYTDDNAPIVSADSLEALMEVLHDIEDNNDGEYQFTTIQDADGNVVRRYTMWG